jgi:kumamolisin
LPEIPVDHVPLKGSERQFPAGARQLGPAAASEQLSVTIVFRRRPDGPRFPDFRAAAMRAHGWRKRMPSEEFAAKYGGHPAEIALVSDYLQRSGLTLVEENAARRTVTASGSIERVSKAFSVELRSCEVEIPAERGRRSYTGTFRCREGSIYVPRDIAEFIVGVFGLDNRAIGHRSIAADPPHTGKLTVPQIAKLYNFPSNSAQGQTIGILCLVEDGYGGYEPSDIGKYYSHLPAGYSVPTVHNVQVEPTVPPGMADIETTQDICIASSAAPGAAVAVYFAPNTQKGWVDLVLRVIHPLAGDPVCSVLSSSFYAAGGDDPYGLAAYGVTTAWVDALSLAFQDAAVQGVTVCVASGDTGVQCMLTDGKAHVQYPASDPWILCCGGTTVGNIDGNSFDEYLWNDSFSIDGSKAHGATGGGVSSYFGQPAYQRNAGVPLSLIDGRSGRGIPDVAANASWNSGYYPIYCVNAGAFYYPNPYPGNGTSASAPLYAGLVAVINAALSESVGFLNPLLYMLGGSVVKDIDGSAGPTNNSFGGVTGYTARAGWDACTGLGRIDGQALLTALRSVGTYQVALTAILAGAID